MENFKFLYGDVVTKNGIITAYIKVKDEKIVGLSTEKPKDLTANNFYNYKGMYIFPGFIDSHVHCFSNPNEGFESTSVGAVFGGVTTFIDMPYDRPNPINNKEIFIKKRDMIHGKTLVDMALWATIPKKNGVKEIPGLIDAGAAAFKMSTFETDPYRFPKISDIDIFKSLKEIKSSGLVTAFHSENNEMIVELTKLYKEKNKVYPKAHMETRPIMSETTAVQKLCEIAKWTSGKLHIVHVSAPQTIDIIQEYRNIGVDVTCETCYQYLVFDINDLEAMGPRAKMNPPLREPAEVAGLWKKLEEGKIDYVTSDHSPWDKEEKHKGDHNIFLAPSGLPGIELLAVVMYDAGVYRQRISPTTLAKLLSTNVAKRFGFTNKGSIELGKDADFAILDPNGETVVTDESLHTKTNVMTPFNNKTLNGKIFSTWVRGEKIFEDGQIFANMDYGKFVPGIGLKE